MEILLTAEQRVQIHASVPGWSLAELTPGDGYEGALVIQDALAPIQCYQWESGFAA